MTFLKIVIAVVVGEVLIHVLLYVISRFIGKTNKDKISRTSVLKGVLERFFVVVTLWFGLTHALTLLGALKIATRIKDTEDKVSNDFFLIGNLVSVLAAIGYWFFIKSLVVQ